MLNSWPDDESNPILCIISQLNEFWWTLKCKSNDNFVGNLWAFIMFIIVFFIYKAFDSILCWKTGYFLFLMNYKNKYKKSKSLLLKKNSENCWYKKSMPQLWIFYMHNKSVKHVFYHIFWACYFLNSHFIILELIWFWFCKSVMILLKENYFHSKNNFMWK